MNTFEQDIYQRARAEGIPAKSALGLARFVNAHKDDELPDYGSPVTIERDGFDLRLTLDYDEGMSLADFGYGTFEDGHEDWRTGYRKPDTAGAIPNTDRDSRNPSGGAAFYVPSEKRDTVVRYFNGPTYGASKSVALDLAREQEQDELERAIGDGYGPSVYVLTVEAMREGVELGRAVLGGIELGWSKITRTDGREYLAECVDDLAPEAIEEARETLAKLREVV